MPLFEIPLTEVEAWDQAVKRVLQYDAFYLNAYARAFQLHGDGEPLLLVYESGEDYAVNVVFRRDVAEDPHFRGKLEPGQYYDLSSPYGYGGFIGNVHDWNALESEWDNYCKTQGYICEFVRFELFGEYRNYFSGTVESHTHNVVRELEMPLGEMWMDFKQKVRKNVKRATTYGLEIILDPVGEYLSDFLRVYYGTMDRTAAKDAFYFSEEFFKTLNEMKNNIMYFYAVYHGKIISAELVIYGSKNCYSYLGGTDRDYFEMRPNDFLKYEIIKWAKQKGLKRFILGGGYGTDDGIFQYKACLAPHGVMDFYVGNKVLDRTTYDRLLEIRKENGPILRERYFPQYRA